MTPRARKVTLTLHVIASVGWLGAVVAFLALALVGMTSDDASRVRAVYVATGILASTVIVPLSLASLATGLVQSLGSKWGLFRHYWIVVKLVINVFSSIFLQVHMQPIAHLADIAAAGDVTRAEHGGLQLQLLAAAVAAALALLVATALAVAKPRGLTPYGRRKRREAFGR